MINNIKTVLCTVPDGPLDLTLEPLLSTGIAKRDYQVKKIDRPLTFDPPIPIRPIGVLRVYDWMRQNGYDADIYDANCLRPSDKELIETFKKFKPNVVGLGASLSHCYPNVKRIAKMLRQQFPDIWIIVGGHITATANVLLHKTEADICVIGNGEIPFVKLLDYFKLYPNRNQINYNELSQIKGIAFIDENNKLKVTGNAEQLPESKLHHPDYDKLKADLQKTGGQAETIRDYFIPIKKLKNFWVTKYLKRMGPEIYEEYINKRVLELETSRGCVARCTFCQRAEKGYRIFAPHDLESFILDVKKKYNIGIVKITDENPLSNKKQAYEIARIFKRCGIFWIVGAARVTTVSYEDMQFYKAHNMMYIGWGIETGSRKILDVMEKKTSKEENYNRIADCKKLGIWTLSDSLVLGMPGETRETIMESGEFVGSIRHLLEQDWCLLMPDGNWVIDIPGTPLYEYSQQIGLIGKTLEAEEAHLLQMAEQRASFFNYINKTSSNNPYELYYWNFLFNFSGKYKYKNLIIKSNESIKNKISKIYTKCVKPELQLLKIGLKTVYGKKSRYRGKKLPKFFGLILYHLIIRSLNLSILFLPKAILFPIVRLYSNSKFYLLKRKYRIKQGQKYNIFIEKKVDLFNKYKLTEERIAETERQKQRSLRDVVMTNRLKMAIPSTDEEKGFQLLSEGR